jgi:hypothetical protein
MKSAFTFSLLLAAAFAHAQLDSVRQIEPNRQTSFDNQDLLLISLAALAILLAIYFLFRRARRTRN